MRGVYIHASWEITLQLAGVLIMASVFLQPSTRWQTVLRPIGSGMDSRVNIAHSSALLRIQA